MRVMPKIEATGNDFPNREGIDKLIGKYQFAPIDVSAVKNAYDGLVQVGDVKTLAFDAALWKMDNHYAANEKAPFERPSDGTELGAKRADFNRSLQNGIVAMAAVVYARGYETAERSLDHSGGGIRGIMHRAMAETIVLIDSKRDIWTEFAPLGTLAEVVLKAAGSHDRKVRSRAYVAQKFLSCKFMEDIPLPRLY